MFVKTLHKSRINGLLWNTRSCNISKVTLVFLQHKRIEKFLGIQLGFSSKRAVHYEPHLDEALDRKQKEILQSFNITLDDCKYSPKIWNIHPQTIEQHGLVLQEGGFKKLTASLIVNYFRIVKTNIKLLKIYKYINSGTSVVDSYLHSLGNPPLDKLNLKVSQEDENQFIDVYNAVLKSYLIWRLDSTASEIDQICKVYARIKHRSLKYILWSLDMLENDLGFTKEKIRKHGYLIHSYPHNILDILQRVPELCGKDIKEVLLQHPKIVMTSTNTILATLQHLKNYGIPDAAVHRCFEVFTLSSDSMLKRLQQVRTVPELTPFADNLRVLQIVHYHRKVRDRIEKLQVLQRHGASLHVLTSNQAYFERFTREGIDRTRGTDVVNFLARKLGAEESVLRGSLGRHPFWCSISCVSVQSTLELLFRNDFKNEDILNNLHLLLYPSDQVEQILTGLSTSQAVKSARDLARRTNPSKECVLTKNTELALCLYFLEKDHHFTGNGIWNTS